MIGWISHLCPDLPVASTFQATDSFRTISIEAVFHSSRGWSRWPTGKNTTSQFMRVLLKRYQGPPRQGASSTKIWMLLDRVQRTYLTQNSWEFKGTMPNKALLSRPYFLGRGWECGVTPSIFLNKTRPPKIRHQGSIDCIGGVPTFLRVCEVNPPCFKVTPPAHLYKILQEACISSAIFFLPVWSFTDFVRLAKKSQHLKSKSHLPLWN